MHAMLVYTRTMNSNQSGDVVQLPVAAIAAYINQDFAPGRADPGRSMR